jgi:PcRGLX-like protein central beta sandwich domain/PcRGLX-like N-terminal RIFT barrel domain
MTHKILLIISILLILPSKAWGANIPMTVEEPTGINRQMWPVTSGVPLSQGALKNPSQVKLLHRQTEIPLQTEVLSKWLDGSIKWLLLDFQIDLKANEKKNLSLIYGPETRPGVIDDPIRIDKEQNALTITTGPIQYKINKKEFRLLDSLWLDKNRDGKFSDEERLTSPEGSGIELKTPDGQNFWADAAEAKISIEQSGPVRACIRVDGKHASPEGEMFSYILRIHAFKGKPFLRIHYTFINDHQDTLMAKIDSLNLNFTLNGKSSTGILEGKKTNAARLFQVDDRRFEINGIKAGKRASGWAAVGNGENGFAIGMRQFWQNWPKSIEVEPRSIKLGVCPQFPAGLYDGKPIKEESKLYYYLRDGAYTFKVGLARTHEIWATFFNGAPNAKHLGRFFSAAEDPLLATCDPTYVSATGAIGNTPPADKTKYYGYDKWVYSAMKSHLKRREKIREYGMLNYGDWYGERQVNWGNLEYDLAHGLFIQYLRTGDRQYFLRAEQAARHHIDVDIVHATNDHLKNPEAPSPWGDPPAIGEIWVHSIGHTGGYYQYGKTDLPVKTPYLMGYSRNFGHVWAQGDFDYYHLTGDRRAREVAIKTSDALTVHCPTSHPTHIRSLGWPMILLLSAYDSTGDEKYLEAAEKNWLDLKEKIDWKRGWIIKLSSGHCSHPPGSTRKERDTIYIDQRCHGNVPFMVSITLAGLSRYHRITQDPEVLKAITVGIDQMVRETWQEDKKTFRANACPLSDNNNYTLFSMSAEALAYEAALTGNKEHLRILREGMRSALTKTNPKNYSKTMSMVIHFAPFGLDLLE